MSRLQAVNSCPERHVSIQSGWYPSQQLAACRAAVMLLAVVLSQVVCVHVKIYLKTTDLHTIDISVCSLLHA